MDCRIEPAAGENERLHAFGQMHRDIRVLVLKPLQARNKPAGGKGREGGYIDTVPVKRLPHQVLTVPLQTIKDVADLTGVSPSIRRKPNPISDAFEESDP